MKEFADRLKMIQRSKRMSQAQLAKTLGISPGTLSGYLNDKNNPQINDVARFAQVLGVTVGWLCGEDKPNITDMFNNGNSNYGDILEVTDRLIKSQYLGFHIAIEGDCPFEEVVFTTQNKVLLDYYKVYTTMNKLVNTSGITPDMQSDLLYSKRKSLSDKKLNGETIEFVEIDDNELPWD